MSQSSIAQATHVNSGTSLSKKELKSRTRKGSQISLPKLQVLQKKNENVTAMGGLGLLSGIMKAIQLPKLLSRINVLKSYRPYTECDHILTHVANLFLGGGALEDITELQVDPAACRLLGAGRIPDPTTAGDFLRRFDSKERLDSLLDCLDQALQNSWKFRYGRKKQPLIEVDIDSHLHSVYGDQKELADFHYKGGLGFHPLIFSVARTDEVLRLINRPGNATSAEGTAAAIDELVPLLHSRFRKVVFRGDSAFARKEIFDACEAHDCFFAFCCPRWSNLLALAGGVPESSWILKTKKPVKSKRKKGVNRRQQQVVAREKRNISLKQEWYAEVPYTPVGMKDEFRLIIRRQEREVSEQKELFTHYFYSFYITNLPASSYSPEKVVAQSYHRCDQENVIEQLKNEVSAMRMPCREYHANSAYMLCAQLAQNLKCWLCLIALPGETVRWEWKRFRRSFVYFPVQVVHHSRQVIVRLLTESRFTNQRLKAFQKLQI